MCGRYGLELSREDMVEWLGIQWELELKPRHNIAPTQCAPVVRGGADGPFLGMLQWGLMPSWSGKNTRNRPLINARAETLHEKPSFKDAFKRRRCLVPADGWYEWSGPRGERQAHMLTLQDGAPFCMAGLWDALDGDGDVATETFTIITTRASLDIEHIHHRMPVIIDASHHGLWLDPGIESKDALGALLTPQAPGKLTHWKVSPRVGNVRFDDPACRTPLVE